MTGVMSMNFSHIIQQFLTLKPVAKNKVSHHFRIFFRSWHWDGRLNSRLVAVGQMEGKGMTFKMSQESKGVKQTKLWAMQVSKLSKMTVTGQQKYYETVQPHTTLYLFTRAPSKTKIACMDHQWPVKSSQQNQATQCCLTLV